MSKLRHVQLRVKYGDRLAKDAVEIFRMYAAKRSEAQGRGILFEFTIEEWIVWWAVNLGPGWINRRCEENYVMARKGDVGPYHPDNVECIPAAQNNIDAWKNGVIKGRPKKNEISPPKAHEKRLVLIAKHEHKYGEVKLWKQGSGSVLEDDEEPIYEAIIEAIEFPE